MFGGKRIEKKGKRKENWEKGNENKFKGGGKYKYASLHIYIKDKYK